MDRGDAKVKKVLVIEDDRFYIDIMLDALKRNFSNIEFEIVEKCSEVKDIIEKGKYYDFVISDVELSGCKDRHLVDLLNAGYRVILLAELGDIIVEDSIFLKNAVDYVVKSKYQGFGYLVKLLNRLFANQNRTVLIVDDSKPIRKFYSKILQKLNLKILEAVDGVDALEKISQNSVDIVLSDYNMPRMDGKEFLQKLRQEFSMIDLPFIVVSADNNESTVAQFLKLEANDYLKKPFVKEELVCRINNTLDMLDMYDKVRDSVNIDALTELYNRHYMHEISEKLLEMSKRYDHKLSLAIFDIDFFKKINDTYGHLAGDIVLKFFASNLRHRVRESDIVIRYGGEEFIVIFPQTDIRKAFIVVEYIRKHIEEIKVEIDSKKMISITISAGIAEYNKNETLEQLIGRADKALYLAKESGRNRVEMAEFLG